MPFSRWGSITLQSGSHTPQEQQVHMPGFWDPEPGDCSCQQHNRRCTMGHASVHQSNARCQAPNLQLAAVKGLLRASLPGCLGRGCIPKTAGTDQPRSCPKQAGLAPAAKHRQSHNLRPEWARVIRALEARVDRRSLVIQLCDMHRWTKGGWRSTWGCRGAKCGLQGPRTHCCTRATKWAPCRLSVSLTSS